MAVLKAKARAKSAVIKQPGAPPSAQKFPIPDKAHAKAALGRINQAKPPLTAAQKAKVKAKANSVLGAQAEDRADAARGIKQSPAEERADKKKGKT